MAGGYAPPLRVDVALLATSFEAYEAHARRQQDRLFTSAERGRPEVGHEIRHQVDVRVGGEAYRLRVSQSRPGRYQVELDGHSADVEADRSGPFELRLGVGGQTFDVLSVAQGADYLVEVDGAVHRISGGEVGLVRAPAPAMVVAVRVTAENQVAEGDVVAIVESMKMETALRAPAAGRVAEVFADVNTQVDGGAKLVRIEPEADQPAEPEAGQRADLSALAEAAGAEDDRGPAAAMRNAADALAALRSLVLGFDVDEAEARRQLQRLAAARAGLPADDPHVLAGEAEICRSSPTCPPCGATAGRPASRPLTTRPPSTMRPPATRRSTCTLTCARGTPTRKACPSPSGSSCAGPWPTMASATWSRRPSSTRCSTGSSWPTAGRRYTCRWWRNYYDGGCATRSPWARPRWPTRY